MQGVPDDGHPTVSSRLQAETEEHVLRSRPQHAPRAHAHVRAHVRACVGAARAARVPRVS